MKKKAVNKASNTRPFKSTGMCEASSFLFDVGHRSERVGRLEFTKKYRDEPQKDGQAKVCRMKGSVREGLINQNW